MAKTMFLDIETLPAAEADYKKMRHIWQRKKEKAKHYGKSPISFEEFIEWSSLSGAYGRICCISYAFDNEEPTCLEGDEEKMLTKFWQAVREANLFVGHNLLDFDLPFIFQRSVILKIKPTVDISLRRYSQSPVFDTMHEWSKWDMSRKTSLDELCHLFDIPTSKSEMDGSMVHQYYQKGKIDEIKNYCNADVKATREIYKRLTFQ